MTGDQFAFSFGEVEGKTVHFADHGDQVDDEGRCQGQEPPGLRLRCDDLRGRHRAGHEEDRNQGHSH